LDSKTINSKNTSIFVEIGKIGRPHGVRGEVRFFLHNTTSDLVFTLSHLGLSMPDSNEFNVYEIQHIKEGGKYHILSLKGIRNRDAAQKVSGMIAKVEREKLPDLDDGEFYIADLIGLTVTCDGQSIGKIVDSREQGGVEVISVENDTREIQIPVVDDYVSRMDVSEGIFEVHNIAHLPVFEFSRKGH